MKKLKFLMVMLVLVTGLFYAKPVKAQCAACAATVESSNKSGGDQTKGLNNGILFLLAAPYLAAGFGAYLWYKKYRRKEHIDLNMKNEKIHLN